MDTPIARPASDDGRFSRREHVAATGSTNADLVDRARAGAPEQVLVADFQEAGRGRLGRTWQAPARSSLLCSILVRPSLEIDDLHLVTTALGVASVDACREVAGVSLRCKWPNDLVTHVGTSPTITPDLKVSGILAESVVGPSASGVVVVAGIGVNVNWPDELPDDLAATATSLRHLTGIEHSVADLANSVVEWFTLRLQQAETTPDQLIDAAQQCSATLGRRIHVVTPSEEFDATADRLDADGSLVVTRGDRRQRLTVGDITHVRPL